MEKMKQIKWFCLMLISCTNLVFKVATENVVTYKLFTQDDIDNGMMLDGSYDNIEKRDRVVLLAHGWAENATASYMSDIKNKVLAIEDVNFILVDWSPVAGNLNYTVAAGNTFATSFEIVNFLGDLMEKRITDPKDVYLIGFSLGSQLVGFVGQNFKTRTGKELGRITGLDPAGPGFIGQTENFRLSKDDAKFVDVIHTDGFRNDGFFGALGTLERWGNVDFYPNGGFNQSGCEGRSYFEFCDHLRAPQLFLDSISLKNTEFVAYMCDSYEEFKNGACAFNEKTIMGWFADIDDNSHGKYYLFTNNQIPFAVYHYLVEIRICSEELKDNIKSIAFQLVDRNNGQSKTMQVTKNDFVNNVYKYVTYSSSELEYGLSMKITVTSNDDNYNFKIRSLKVLQMSDTISYRRRNIKIKRFSSKQSNEQVVRLFTRFHGSYYDDDNLNGLDRMYDHNDCGNHDRHQYRHSKHHYGSYPNSYGYHGNDDRK